MKYFMYVLFISALLIGCKQNPTSDTDSSTNADGIGNITGNSRIEYRPHDDTTARHSGITVSLEGTTKSAISDFSGSWTITNVANGTYTIIFTKPGYTTKKQFDYQYTKGVSDIDSTVTYLNKLPSWYFSSLTSQRSGSTVKISGSLVGTRTLEYYYAMRIFFSTSSNVSSDPSKYQFSIFNTPVEGTPSNFTTIDSVTFVQQGLASGQQVYAVAYVEYSGAGRYLDQATGRYVYPGLNPTASPTTAVIVP